MTNIILMQKEFPSAPNKQIKTHFDGKCAIIEDAKVGFIILCFG